MSLARRVACGGGLAFGLAAAALADGAPPPEAELTLSAPLGEATQVVALADWAAAPPALQLVLLDAEGHGVGSIPVPATEDAYFGLRALREADVDGDGDGDLLALAEYASGIGPSGAEPFPQGLVWLRGPEGFVPAPELAAPANDADGIAGMDALLAEVRAAAGG